MEFDAAVELFFQSRAPRKDSVHTIAAYRRDLMQVAAHAAHELGDDSLSCARLSPAVMRAAFASYSQPRAKASISRAWSVWNAFFSFCVGAGIVDGNPMSGVAKPAAASRAPKPLRDGEAARRLLEAVASGERPGRNPWPQRDLAILATLLLTGVRSSELLALRVGDIAGPVDESRVVVRGGKGDADRVVPVEPGLRQLLDDYAQSRRERFQQARWPISPDAPLFIDHRGRAMTRNQLQYLVRQCYHFAGVADQVDRGTLVHALRHTFATRLGQSGASAVEIMELLGHRSLTATQSYIKATARELRDAAASNPTYMTVRAMAQRSSEDVKDGVDSGASADDER